MASVNISIRVTGLEGLKKALSSKFVDGALKKRIPSALKEAGNIASDEIKGYVKSGSVRPANAFLTIKTKSNKANTPLFDKGNLLNGLKVFTPKWNKVTVGFNKGTKAEKLASIMVKGHKQTITDDMRALFKSLWLVSQNKMHSKDLSARAQQLWNKHPHEWFPLSASKSHLITPPRPFIKQALQNNRKFKSKFEKAVNRALSKVIRDLSLEAKRRKNEQTR